MTTTKTITNAWVNKTLPDIFYEEPEPPEDAVLQELSIRRLINLLWGLYEDREDVFMSGMVFVAYNVEDGNARVAPDFFIAFDVPNFSIRRNLPNYWMWEIGKPPDFAMEVASPSTASNDLGRKRELYADLGITEYWRFDETGGELYGQPIAGERLVDGEYQPYEVDVGEGGSVKVYSELLNLDFYWDGYEFDALDPVTRQSIDKLQAAEERADAAQDARIAAERRADAAQDAHIAAEKRADAAELRAETAEAREQALLEELERLRRQQQ